MFLFITIFFIPLFYIYSSHEAYYDQKSWPISRLMLGNLGGSSIFCQQIRMGKGTFTVSCPIGSYIKHDKALFGIINQDIPEKKVCM
jgi:hypothetical protein